MNDEDMQNIREFLLKLDGRLEKLEENVSDIKHVVIDGNGKPPMTVRLALAEAELERVKEERVDKKMPRTAWLGIVVSIILAVASIGASFA
jgi:hypothetical protein